MRPLFLFVLLAAPALAQTTAPSLQNLLQNSPFGSATANGLSAVTNTPLEFRGTFVDRGERFFSIFDTGARRAEWVGLNESGHPFLVKGYDADNETVMLDYQGRSLSLKLRAAKIAAMAMPPPQVAAPPQPGAGPAPGTVNASMPTTTEAQRLALVAEEIRRRRALRQQAQQQPPANTPPPSQPPR